MAAADYETTVSEHLCGTVQFPTFQLPFPVKNDNIQSNGKQIAPKLQITTSCDVKEKKKSHSLPMFPALSLFYCLSLYFAFPFVLFSVPKPQQLWEISPSCQHFDFIVECVNQAGARCAKSNSSHSLFRALCRGINFDCHTELRNPGRNWPAHLIFVPSTKQTQHESTNLFKTTCSGSLWIFSLLAVNTCMAGLHGSFFFFFFTFKM